MGPRTIVLLAFGLVLVVAAAVLVVRNVLEDSGGSALERQPETGASPETLARRLTEVQEKTERMEKTVWVKEIRAQEHGAVIEAFWDGLNRSEQKLKTAGELPLATLIVPAWLGQETLSHGIMVHRSRGESKTLDLQQWRAVLAEAATAGWIVVRTEFRHNQFTETDGVAQSRFYFCADLINSVLGERATIEGDLMVHWDSGRPPAIQTIDASELELRTAPDVPCFALLLERQVVPPKDSYFIDPLIVMDLDQNGFSEILLVASNQLYRRQPGGDYEAEPLTRQDIGLIFTAVAADFTGNGTIDLLCARFEGLILFEGESDGSFAQPSRVAWQADPRLKYAQALTCGDVDGDGDLDAWLGQYKLPYDRGQMPTPYFDANDGYPSYLLLNNGQGEFTDHTIPAGLESKRHRRVYTASLADLDSDHDLDLVVVSDFAGVDLYANDGAGQFRDVTETWVDEAHAFGMAHALCDFNTDGTLDLLVIGMNSPTADRLDAAGLHHPDYPVYDQMRQKMAFGNRLYFGRNDPPRFQQTPLGKSLARSGWSWGCGAADFNNDRFLDVYIANGHRTDRSVRDYESEFWLHDIYVTGSSESIVGTAYFGSKFSRAQEQGHSHGGYEKNRLYLNRDGQEFIEAGHLMGVGLPQDSRNVAASDLNNDGKIDLIVTTFETWPEPKQTIQIFENRLETGDWIGFRFGNSAGKPSPIGARVILRAGETVAARQIVAGDSYRTQHDYSVHFGLGQLGHVDQIEVHWPNGGTTILKEPGINRYHMLQRE